MTADSKRRVLLVDDDVDYLEQLRIQFEKLDYDVTTAGNETEAMTVLEESLPDLAVLDLMMDTMDGGFSLAHWIKQRDADLPVIMVTGVTAETGLVFEKSGPGEKSWIKADAVLAKPVRFEQIIRELGKLGLHHE
jgi:two-component system, OmpR family, response regulator